MTPLVQLSFKLSHQDSPGWFPELSHELSPRVPRVPRGCARSSGSAGLLGFLGFLVAVRAPRFPRVPRARAREKLFFQGPQIGHDFQGLGGGFELTTAAHFQNLGGESALWFSEPQLGFQVDCKMGLTKP